jgi:hypothetical protein
MGILDPGGRKDKSDEGVPLDRARGSEANRSRGRRIFQSRDRGVNSQSSGYRDKVLRIAERQFEFRMQLFASVTVYAGGGCVPRMILHTKTLAANSDGRVFR